MVRSWRRHIVPFVSGMTDKPVRPCDVCLGELPKPFEAAVLGRGSWTLEHGFVYGCLLARS